MPKHRIVVVLSKIGQKAAVLANHDARAVQEFMVDARAVFGEELSTIQYDTGLLKDMLDAGARVESDGAVILDTNVALPGMDKHFQCDVPPSDARSALAAFVAAQADAEKQYAQAEQVKAAEEEKILDDLRATQHEWLVPYIDGNLNTAHPWGGRDEINPTKPYDMNELRWLSANKFQRESVQREYKCRQKEQQAAEAKAEARDRAAREAKEQAEHKAELAREQRLCELVRPLDASAAARIDAGGEKLLGLLPESEALDILRDHVLPILDGLKAYERMRKADVCRFLEHGDDQDCGKVSFLKFEGQELPALDRETWNLVQATKAKLILADLGEPVLIAHRGRCENHDDCPDVWRFGMKVARDLGEGLVIEREYGV